MLKKRQGKHSLKLLEQKQFLLKKELYAQILVSPRAPRASTEALCLLSKGMHIEIVIFAKMGFQEIQYSNWIHFNIKGLAIEPEISLDQMRPDNIFKADLKDVIDAIS